MDLPPSLVRLAACQDGIVTRQQAFQHGLTVAAVRHLLGRGGRWQRMVTGVYTTFTGPFQERHLIRAGLPFAGPSAPGPGAGAAREDSDRAYPADADPACSTPGPILPVRTAGAGSRRRVP